MPGVVSVLDEEAEALVRGLWREIEERCGFEPQPAGAIPHLTYHAAAAYQQQPVLAALADIARRCSPFEIECSGLGVFTGDRIVLYLAVARPQQLSDLHRQVIEAVQPLSREAGPYWQPDRWVPHVTLAMDGLTPAIAGDLVAAWAHRPAPARLKISNVAVMDDGDGTHRLLAECALGGQAGDLG